MTNFDEAWNSSSSSNGDGYENRETVQPEPGTYNARVVKGRFFKAKSGDRWLVVEYETDEGHYWSDMTKLSDGEFAREGAIRAARATLDSLGVGSHGSMAEVDDRLSRLVGHTYIVDVIGTDYTRKDGTRIINTRITGKVSAAPEPVAQPPVESSGFTAPPLEPVGAASDEIPF